MDREEKLASALSGVMRLLLPMHMALSEREMVDDPVPDDAVVFSFMGSGASDRVTAGEFRKATEEAQALLHAEQSA